MAVVIWAGFHQPGQAEPPRFNIVEIVTPEGVDPLNTTTPRQINDLDQVVGNYTQTRNPYVWLPEAAYGLPAGFNTIDYPGKRVIARTINDEGIFGGEAFDLSTGWGDGAFLGRVNGEIVQQVFFNGESNRNYTTHIADLNNSGGYVGEQDIRWTYGYMGNAGGAFTHIPHPIDDRHDTFMVAIDEKGHVAGTFLNDLGAWRGFFWDGGATLLDTHGGPLFSLKPTGQAF